MVTRAGLYIAAAALLAALGGIGVYHWMSAKVDRLESQVQAAQATIAATNRAVQTKDQAIRSLTTKYNLKSKELDDVLKSNPDWAAGRVPDPVYDSLFDSH